MYLQTKFKYFFFFYSIPGVTEAYVYFKLGEHQTTVHGTVERKTFYPLLFGAHIEDFMAGVSSFFF